MANDAGKPRGRTLSKQELKDFRHKVSLLRKKGIVSKRVSARTQEPTKYMRAKVRKFEDVLAGNALAVKAPKDVRERYRTDSDVEVRGTRLIVPTASGKGERATLKRGKLVVTRKLKGGSERTIIMPFKMGDMRELTQRLIDDQELDDEIFEQGHEMLSFRVGGNNSQTVFANTAEMGHYLQKYANRLDHPIRSARQVKSLITFQSFVPEGGYVPERNPNELPLDKRKSFPKADKRGRNRDAYNDTYPKQKRARHAAKMRKLRAEETPAARKARLAANARRSAQWRQRQWEDS